MPDTAGEVVQLDLDIFGMLATQRGVVGSRIAGPVRAVTAHAGRHTALGITTAVELLPQFHQLGVCRTDGGLLTGVKRGEVLPVAVRQANRHALHGVIVAFTVLEVGKLLDEIVLVLAGQFGPLRVDAVAIGAMAGCTAGGLALAGLRIAGRLRRTQGGRNQNSKCKNKPVFHVSATPAPRNLHGRGRLVCM